MKIYYLFLLICLLGCSNHYIVYKFNVGDIVKVKLDGRIGIVTCKTTTFIEREPFYMVKFSVSNSITFYEEEKLEEFELQKN